MPRIRTIKPEFWRDEKLACLTAQDRLVFLGLIGMSDDFGRVHDNVKVIDAFIFPNSSETVRESLANLSRMNRIRRGKASNGMPVIEIVNWSKHQRVDKPQRHLALPAIDDKYAKTLGKDSIPECFQNDSGTIPELVATLPGTRDQGSGTRDQGTYCADALLVSEVVEENPKTRKFVPPSIEEIQEEVDKKGLAIDAEEFEAYYAAQGWKLSNGLHVKDWKKCLVTWRKRNEKNNSNTKQFITTRHGGYKSMSLDIPVTDGSDK